jgi:DNA processing protein
VVLRGHFAARNRLLVSLAQAVVVVECPDASGALHGARLAWSEQLPLWVVPADTDRCSAKGSNGLLARGATPLLEPADLLASLGEAPLAPQWQSTQHQPSQPIAEGSAADALLKALGAGASLEQLGQRLDQPLPKLAERLLQLELAGVVEPAPGLCWRPRHNVVAT